jgi:hypothetical protein
MKRQDWLLLVVDAARDKRMSPVQLQKTLFLLGQAAPKWVGRGFYKFIPYDYGPFDATIYDDARGLATQGMLEIIRLPGETWHTYSCTPNGQDRAQGLREDMKPERLEYVNRLVSWVKDLSFNDLLRAVYKAYPRYAENSVFQD